MRDLSKIEHLLGAFLESKRPLGKNNYHRAELAELIAEEDSFDIESVKEILYDELGTLRKPKHIEDYHIAYSITLDRLFVTNLNDFDSIKWIKRVHDETIDSQISFHINSLTPRAFEYFLQQIMRKSVSPRFSKVKVSQATRDGGIDVSALQIDEDGSKQRVVVEAKKWAGPIGPAIVDRLIQVMERESERYDSNVKGIIITINGATAGARELAMGKDIEVWDIGTLIRIAKESEVGVKFISVPVIDDEWDAYDIEI